MGSGLCWIGLDYVMDVAAGTITVRVPEAAIREAVDIAKSLLSKPMGPLKDVRRLAGKGSWVFAIAPRTRWTIQRLLATVSYALA